jgi:Ser/Thr protein kinase RdoA (MazF antagonist)
MAPEIRHRILPADLNTALETIIRKRFGSQRIKKWRRRMSVYSSSYTIENLKVELDDGRDFEMVLKDLSPSSLLKAASQVRPHFLYEPLREIETYEKILNPLRIGAPFCYGTVASPDQGRYWLFLERVNGPLLWQRGRMESWKQAARWLAGLHDAFDLSPEPQNPSRLSHLWRYDKEFFNLWLIRAEEFLRRRSDGNGHTDCKRFGRLMDRYDRVVNLLTGLPATFIHGEFYPSNVILRQTGEGRKICPVDWELAAIGPGTIDLAALTSGDWTEDQIRMMIAAYRDALDPENRRKLSLAELVDAVTHCQLHISVQLLGWACDWSPPQRHSQDWLRQAFRLADMLGV